MVPSQIPTIFETTTESQTRFILSSDNTNLVPGQEFKLNVAINPVSPTYFAQAVIQFDSDVLEVTAPSQPLHQLTKHTDKLIADNLLRVSATSLDENNLDLTKIPSLVGSQNFASVSFKVKPNAIKTSTIIKVQEPKMVNDQIDWTNSSAITTVVNEKNIVNLLQGSSAIDLNIALPETKAQVASESAFPNNFNNLFEPVTEFATEIPGATISANASESAELNPIDSEPEPTVTVTVPEQVDQDQERAPDQSLLQRIVNFFSSLLGL